MHKIKLTVIGVIIATGLVVAFTRPVGDALMSFVGWVDGLGAWGPLLVSVAYVPATVFFIPGSILTLGAGALFGVVIGTIAVSVGSTVGSTAAFLVGRFFARDWVAARVEGNAKFAALDRAVGRNGFKIVLLTRLSPIFPYNMLGYVYGLTDVPLSHYVLASWIGMLPGTVMYVYFGSLTGTVAAVAAGGASDVAGSGYLRWLLYGLGLVAAGAVTLVVSRIATTALRAVTPACGAGAAGEPRAVRRAAKEPPTRREPVSMHPMDEHNRTLVDNVHPSDWVNPTPPRSPYDMVVVGAGTAGLITAIGAAGLGKKVALIERHLMGGDCLNVGCVPSKALIRLATAAAAVRRAADFGVHAGGDVSVDFAKVMERVRRLRAALSPHDSAKGYTEQGVDVYLGSGRFTGPDTLDVEGRTLRFKKACIATGARAAAPPIPGLNHIAYLTNETLFELTELPKTLGVIGAGPIGCELAQAFARLGSEVYLVEAMHGVLPNEDPEASEIVRRAIVDDGVHLLCCGEALQLSQGDGTGVRLQAESHGHRYDLRVDRLLVAVGRTPNSDGLGLEAAHVRHDERGVIVDDRLRTSNPHIYAAGDICFKYKFTHVADANARLVVRNALLGWIPRKPKASDLVIPWCTYTDPEIAHVGTYAKDLDAAGLRYETVQIDLAEVDRAVLESETAGLLKVHVTPNGRILGATLVSRHAGESISEITTAIVHGIKLQHLSKVIHPYPTQAEAIKRAGDQFFKQWLLGWKKRLTFGA